MGLIYMQVSYIEAMVRMRRQHFEEGVKRSLYQAAYNLELDETRYYLTKDIQRDIHQSYINDGFLTLEHRYMISSGEGSQYTIESSTKVKAPISVPKFKSTGNRGQLSLREQQRLAVDVLRRR